eukprot:scaffold5787_cov157-Amphora_coffeaeformis.AAC.2
MENDSLPPLFCYGGSTDGGAMLRIILLATDECYPEPQHEQKSNVCPLELLSLSSNLPQCFTFATPTTTKIQDGCDIDDEIVGPAL